MPKLPTNLAAVYGVVASDLQQKLGDAQAAQAGPPVTQKVAPVTNAARVDAWNARDPKATDEAMMQLAMQKYQQHLGTFGDPEKARRATAEDLTHFRYGQRLKLYTYGAVGYAEQVDQAEQLARLARRSSTPDPPPPPPSMATAILTNAETTGMPATSRQEAVGGRQMESTQMTADESTVDPALTAYRLPPTAYSPEGVGNVY